MGKFADEYIGGRVDKACIIKNEQKRPTTTPEIKKIRHIAKIKAPFAVFTR